MLDIFIVGIGGFIGAILRYILAGLIQDNLEFPLGTLSVNVIGSFLISLVMHLSELEGLFSAETRLFLTVGVIASFTTMSTFSYELFKLFEEKETFLMIMYLLGNILVSFFAVYLGRITVLVVWRR
ncbi:camphor resistance protein CrcB [Archaeoglobus sulfaticallidus PM70-1]|uniref:Fluoride-specific ion channel FluC n=1 Tax=Archaeoglobus sulfaticallidus PM70-1 TaxID=387631 RepID=N0BF30_9EURY|nr:fluoride efflux transporter CrcB [Archaeoglobus sulfaticallidus]AGK61628.1 camphor resistance protein CrcB [Archaeoglobus sulfaticallidus PM70-1]